MNELHFAHKVRQHLNLGLQELPPATLDRLAAARENALSCQRQTINQTVLAVAGSFVQHQIENLRVKQTFTALALLMCIVFSTFWVADMHISEQGEIDSELLADDLPIGAFTDKGFAAWLNPTSLD